MGEHGMAVFKDVAVPMRDGARLMADVWLPADGQRVADGTFPTLLGRTSYDKEAEWLWVRPVARYFVPRGYAVVLQDIRGRHRSEGKGEYAHTVNPKEGPDGYDTVEWIAAQPWSNGRVGTVGVSHGAVVQCALALHRPPHLAATWLDDTFWNWHTNGARQGGALELDTLGMMFLHGHDSEEAHRDPAVHRAMAEGAARLRAWVCRMPLRPAESPLASVPSLEKVFFQYFWQGAEAEFWRQDCIDFEHHLDRFADVPTTVRCGWFDVFALANGAIYPKLRARLRSPVRLIMGPWVHNAADRSWCGEVEFGPDAALGDLDERRLRWFDRWLRGVDNGVEHEPSVRIFVMGGGDGSRDEAGRIRHGGRWRDEREWPLARTEWARFRLDAGGRLRPLPGPERSRRGEGAAPLTFTFNPDHPVPTVSANVASFYEHLPLPDGISEAMSPPRSRMRSIVTQGPTDQVTHAALVGAEPPYGPLADRDDVLVFRSEPLARAVEVTGPVVARLWVSSDCPDTDFTAKLLDVYPNGVALNLCDGIRRMRFRNGCAREELMEPGRVYEVEVELGPTSNLFMPGHRIRVDISSSNFPRFDVNPNTGEPLGRETHRRVARNTLHPPSHVVLPVIPA